MSHSRNELERELTRTHEASFGWALNCCRGDEVEAADALHDAYLKVLEGKARFAGRSTFRTFLFGVIRRTVQERRRRQRVQQAITRALGTEPRVAAEFSQSILRTERTRRLAGALALLSSRQREVLHLVFYQNMTIAEAAEVMGTGVGTARTHYERGKRRLRELLTAEGEGGAP